LSGYVGLASAFLLLQSGATQREAPWEGTTMRTQAITGVLFIGLLTLVSINTYAFEYGSGARPPSSDEKALDLSKPENLARLTGKWEGGWTLYPAQTYGEILSWVSLDPKDDEKPVVMRSKRRPPGLLGGPEKWSSPGRWAIQGGKLYTEGTRYRLTYTLYERRDGTLVLRAVGVGFGEAQGSELHYEQYKLEKDQVAKFFPGEKGVAGPVAARESR